MELLKLLGLDLGLVLTVSGLAGYIKHAIPEGTRKKLPWYVLTFLPVLCGGGLALLVTTITIKMGLAAGFLASIAYKGEKAINK